MTSRIWKLHRIGYALDVAHANTAVFNEGRIELGLEHGHASAPVGPWAVAGMTGLGVDADALARLDEFGITSAKLSGDRLVLKAGRMTARLATRPAAPFDAGDRLSGTPYDPTALAAACVVLEPFVSDDASRQWTRGVLFRGRCAYATNNVILAATDTGAHVDGDVLLPHGFVEQVVTLGTPAGVLLERDRVRCRWDDDVRVTTTTLSATWPEEATLVDLLKPAGELVALLDSTRDAFESALLMQLDSVVPKITIDGRELRISHASREIVVEIEQALPTCTLRAEVLKKILPAGTRFCFGDRGWFDGPNARGGFVGYVTR